MRFGTLLRLSLRKFPSDIRLDEIAVGGAQVCKSGLRSLATSSSHKSAMSGDNSESQPGQMPGLLKVLEGNPKRLKRIRFLSELFAARNFELRIAGGAVRDMLRGKEPKDIDFATTALPEQTLDIVSKHEDLLRIFTTSAGQRHGTVAIKFKEAEIDFKRIKLRHEGPSDEESKQVKAASNETCDVNNREAPEYDEESPFEITTLRCDKTTDGRHAEVEFISDWRLDAERRDLTINAMFLTLNDGKLIDFYGGESDLERGVVRFVGNAEQRIKEDYLRILRYFRFWSRYSMGKRPDEETLGKLRDNLAGLDQISGERIWQELKKTLSHLPCYAAIELMLEIRLFDHTGLFDEDLTDYDEFKAKVLADVKTAQDNIQAYLKEVLEPKLEANPQDSIAKRLRDLVPTLIFASLIQNDALCENTHKRLRFSNIERDTLLYIIANRNEQCSLAPFKYQLAVSPAPERGMLMLRMKAFLISRGLFAYIDELEAWKVPQFPISGRTVALAVKERRLPGQKTKEVLEALKLDWSHDDYKTDEATLEKWMMSKLDAMLQR